VRRAQAKVAVKVNLKYCDKKGKIVSEYKNANIILFDDVWTTGASMIEAGKLLKKAGVDSLSALAITKNRAGRSPVIRHGEID
jgi:predicted amidophosphoribosyltransferase